ncbi:MAG: RNA polymerase sigma-70 factor [Phocaeicola sp.]
MTCTNTSFVSELTSVFTRRQKQFIQFSYSYVRDWEEAEDIVMNAFTTVWEKREELKDHGNLAALLLTAIKNLSLNHIRHKEVRMRAENHMGDTQQKEIALRIATLEACDPEKLFSEEVQTLIQTAICKLPQSSRNVFTLSRIENLTNKEISEKLKISIKTVEYHITRSLRELKVRLKDLRVALLFILSSFF